MIDIRAEMRDLSSAEEFFEYLSLPYDAAVLHVNRLHILKRFNQYLEVHKPEMVDADCAVQFGAYRALLARAYEDFVRSTPAQEKVFKVFQDAQGAHVGLESLRRTLPSHSAS
ncbi:MAG: nitrogenase-stabilizing/protective protein NifW [Steroidobacteraceae bacterium]